MSEHINRFRVRRETQPFSAYVDAHAVAHGFDKGADLLRTRDNAVKAMRAALRPAEDLVKPAYRLEKADEWKVVESKAAVMVAFDAWKPASANVHDDQFQVSEMQGGKRVIVAAARYERVPVIELDHCSPATIAAHSLLEYQFPGIVHSGGYLFRQISGSTSWSDHAWGTGTDDSHNPPQVHNDEPIAWLSRMGQAGLIDFDYALGSRDGKVVRCAAPDFDIEPSSAAESHLWHTHVSWVDHDGAKPPRAVMFP